MAAASFTAYDLFVIGIASTLISLQWQLSADKLALLNATMLGAACLGAFVFGRIADLVGRKRWQIRARRRRSPKADGGGACQATTANRTYP
jgi:MFS family permease